MLRVLIACLFLAPWPGFAGAPTYQEPDQATIAHQRDAMGEALKQADAIRRDGTLDRVLSQARGKLSGLPRSLVGLKVQMPSYLEKPRDERYLAKALAAGKSIGDSRASPIESKAPMVLISFSMPESQIKALMAEAHQIGAVLAVRGLIGGDFKQTVIKLRSLAGEADGGTLIDPTLFRRFEVTAAPTFVLPLEPLPPCTDPACPTPVHVKATGSATFQYFLDLVARGGDAREKAEAKIWLAKYGH